MNDRFESQFAEGLLEIEVQGLCTILLGFPTLVNGKLLARRVNPRVAYPCLRRQR